MLRFETVSCKSEGNRPADHQPLKKIDHDYSSGYDPASNHDSVTSYSSFCCSCWLGSAGDSTWHSGGDGSGSG